MLKALLFLAVTVMDVLGLYVVLLLSPYGFRVHYAFYNRTLRRFVDQHVRETLGRQITRLERNFNRELESQIIYANRVASTIVRTRCPEIAGLEGLVPPGRLPTSAVRQRG